MRTTRRIVELLRAHPRGLSDDELALATGKTRQQVVQRCRELAEKGILVRDARSGLTVNRILDPTPEGVAASAPPSADPEGNAVMALRVWLRAEGWTVPADAGGSEPEIVARRDDLRWRVGIGAVGAGSGSTVRADMAAGTWEHVEQTYARAFLHAARQWQRHPTDQVAMAVPDEAAYRRLLEATRSALARLAVDVLLVARDGAVRRWP